MKLNQPELPIPDPAEGDSVRWKRFGFYHIAKDKHKTLCGHDLSWELNFSRRYRGVERFKIGKEAENRPLCGNCRRVLLKNKAKHD
jgi:hypothetical protein